MMMHNVPRNQCEPPRCGSRTRVNPASRSREGSPFSREVLLNRSHLGGMIAPYGADQQGRALVLFQHPKDLRKIGQPVQEWKSDSLYGIERVGGREDATLCRLDGKTLLPDAFNSSQFGA